MLIVNLLCHLQTFAKKYNYSLGVWSENASISSNGGQLALQIQLRAIQLYQQLSAFAKYALKLTKSNTTSTQLSMA